MAAQLPDAQGEEELLPQPRVVSHEAGLPVTFSLAPLANFDAAQVVVEPVEPVDRMYSRFGGRCLALRHLLSDDECRYLISVMTSEGSLEQVAYRHDYRCNDRCVFESRELADLLWGRVRPFAEALAVAADPAAPERQRLLGADGNGPGVGGEAEAEGEADADACPEELRLPYGRGGVWRPVGLNECLRFCRYNAGGFFRPHCDAIFRRSDDEMSLFTCMLYLDGGSFSGGATRFLRVDGTLSDKTHLQPAAPDQVLATLAPQPGLCLLFFQPGLLHEGQDVVEGCKHILRSDVMFRRDPGSGPQRTPQEELAWQLVQEAQAAEANFECDRACQLYRRAFKLDPKLERAF